SNLTFQKRIAASVLGCGKRKVWLDPNEMPQVATAKSRADVRKFIKTGLITKKPEVGTSRERFRAKLLAKRAGRHRGFGKRKGTAEARMPSSLLWMRRQRALRTLL
ncbi:ribosomal protein L19/L19e, partial [Caulochytrium protostelioides]